MSQAERKPRVHISGIGGTAMVAGARLALEAGWEVRGSDNPLYPPTSHMVEDLGVEVYEGFQASNLDWQPDLVLIGNALSRGNEEVEEVLRRRIPYMSLPEWMRHNLLHKRKPVVVSGTHGKTTTTSLTAFLLDRLGMNPGYLVGGEMLDFKYSSHLGAEGAPFVIEGDEYDTAFFDKRAKFFHYMPEIAVVTSVEFDHGDIYRDIEEIERAFRLMLRQIPPGGWLIANADDARAADLVNHAHSRTTTYGFSESAHWRGEETGVSGGFSGLIVTRGGKRFAELALPLYGRHNLSNALAAVVVGGILGLNPVDMAGALMNFRGVRRRMEVFHEVHGKRYVDDFAHHPTAIRLTLEAARQRWSGERLIAVVEPRSNTMVTRTHESELIEALRLADEVILGPIHRAERIPEEKRLDRENIKRELMKSGISVKLFDEAPKIAAELAAIDETPYTALILSNGGFGGLHARIKEMV